MVKITFIIYDKCSLSGVLGIKDAFVMANLWNFKIESDKKDIESHTDCKEPLFITETASLDGKPINDNNGIIITPDKSINSVQDTDLILIPAFISSNVIKKESFTEILEWISESYHKGVSVGAFCTGTFILAMTGLLDGKQATTNWQFIRRFKRNFPNINLTPEKILTVDSNLICSGAVTSIYHIALYVIEKYGSKQLASICSKSFLIDSGRQSQLPYTTVYFDKNHGDKAIIMAQQFMENRYQDNFTIDYLAKEIGLSPRHFKRRFKKATGETPISYLQHIRIDQAKKRLETTNDNINEITWQTGYEDISTFRRLFKKHTSLSPKEYRKKFFFSSK
ncbi:MAG: helix-turn-helix domain-containing protein [Desulfamplus sp.]|nr:helix-turn-helix domain-containing protein [Desulfamplus sp.]MBF0303607.1 helix-turn-helix domain-containing protein [Desulfamplus sp.]